MFRNYYYFFLNRMESSQLTNDIPDQNKEEKAHNDQEPSAQNDQ